MTAGLRPLSPLLLAVPMAVVKKRSRARQMRSNEVGCPLIIASTTAPLPRLDRARKASDQQIRHERDLLLTTCQATESLSRAVGPAPTVPCARGAASRTGANCDNYDADPVASVGPIHHHSTCDLLEEISSRPDR